MKNSSPVLRRIQALSAKEDHQQIMFLSLCYDFPLDAGILSIKILMRSFTIPRVAKVIDGTGVWETDGVNRGNTLADAIARLITGGYDSPIGQQMIAKMNHVHARHPTTKDDFVYLVTRFVIDPIEWNKKYGWRPYCENEIQSLKYFWINVAERMGLSDLPDSIEAMRAFSCEFEKENCKPDAPNHRLYSAFTNVLAGMVRPMPGFVVRLGIPFVLDSKMRRNLTVPNPTLPVRLAAHTMLRTRARLAWLLPTRRKPSPSIVHPYMRPEWNPFPARGTATQADGII